jgi:hypothetical protein
MYTETTGIYVASLKTHYPDLEPNQSLLFFLNAAVCLAEKQQIPIL